MNKNLKNVISIMNIINLTINVYEIYEIMFVSNVEANEFLFPYKYLIIIQT